MIVSSVSKKNRTAKEDQAPLKVSLKDTLAPVKNVTPAAARIQSAFRSHSFRKRRAKEAAASASGIGSIPEISALSKLAFRNSRDHNSAALSIQKKYRGWKGRKDFLSLRQKVVKIQAHVRGYQVRKHYKEVIWAVGILDKVVLRWRRRGAGLRGFRQEMEINENDDEDILKVFQKQKVDVEIKEAVSRVQSMVDSPDAREQYHQMLEKYRQAKENSLSPSRTGPVPSQENSHWLNFNRNNAENSVFSLPQRVDGVKFPAYSSMVETQNINSDYCETLFDQSQLGASPDADSSLTVAQKQKFTIKAVSPEWGYATETTKMTCAIHELASQVTIRTYDVFMSFCNEDTPNNFTDFLFQALCGEGIFAFKDDTHLNTGESIAPEMLQAIQSSHVFIVVFSKNYASSTYCLRQLAHICHWIQTSHRSVRSILPIFYDISPLEVRQQSGCYEKAFVEHHERFKEDKKMMKEVQIWKQALTRVANFSGLDIHNKPQYEVIEQIIGVVTKIMGHKISIWSKEDEDPYKKLSRLMRIKDFISILLTYPMKLEEESIFKSWFSAFLEWKAQLLSADDDTLVNKSWRGFTPKVLRSMEGFVPMDIVSKIERGERSIFNHHDAIPEVILHLTVDLTVNQLIQTLFPRDYSACCVRLLARNLVEKGAVVNKIVAALEEKHDMFGTDRDFLRALWINASTYESDAEVRVQEEINNKMAGSSVTQDRDIEAKMGSNMHLVIVMDADSNKKLDLQKVRFPPGILVLITTESSTEAENDEFRIACTVDLNIRTQDHLLSWEVFCSYVGSTIVRSSLAIQRIAEQIVKECHGHLLATMLVAKYLKHVGDVKQWEVALDKLSNLNPCYDYQYSDRLGISRVMVNAFLNFIWEDMNDTERLCLEIILFVHNIKIGVPQSILVSKCGTIMPGNRAQICIWGLLDHFVLLKFRGEVYLPMETYDIIKSLHSSSPSIIRHGALGLTEAPYIGRWSGLIRIELMDNKICELPESPDCPKLEVLLLQGNIDLMDIPHSFFNHMPLLQHLDLSYTSISDLPPSVFTLIQLKKFYLRGCDLFVELPPQIGQLKNLQEFNLDGTLITHLPTEVGELIKLQSLTLCFDRCHHVLGYANRISNSTIIPPSVMSNLTQLTYLSIDIDPEDERWYGNVKNVLVEIFGLERLEKVNIYVPKSELLELSPAQTSLNFRLIVGHHKRRFVSRVAPEVEEKFKHCDCSMKFVNGVNVPDGMKMILRRTKALYLDRHMTIKSLSDFELENLSRLQACILAECNAMETVVDGSNSRHRPVLANLNSLVLSYMKNLRSIYEGANFSFGFLKSLALHSCPVITTIFTLDSLEKFPYLEEIIVEDCPKLTTLISHHPPEPISVIHLPSLKTISLLYLPELVNICNGLHVGPILEKMVFYYCPKLQSLSKSELSSKYLNVIKGERMWWEALEWNAAEWGDAGRPKHFEQIFSPVDEEADLMKQLAANQETQIRTH